MEKEEFIRLLEYIDEHITEKLSLKELSDLAGYSPYYFSKLFSGIYGIPVTGYIRIRKLQYSLNALVGGMKVLDVALLYSFESHEGFTRSFVRLFGSSPSMVKKYLDHYSIPDITECIHADSFHEKEDESMNLKEDMHQLVFEVVKNSLEEAKEGFCTKVEIALQPGNIISIRDNGRGIPLEQEGKVNEDILNNILAGAPITKLEYSQMGDLPMDSLKIVNSLCERLTIKVYRDGKCYSQDYVRGIAQHSITVTKMDHEHGTQIIMKPDTTIFEKIEFDTKCIQTWVEKNQLTNLIHFVL